MALLEIDSRRPTSIARRERTWLGLSWISRLLHGRLLLLIATLAGAAIRLYDLGAKSLWYDEIISVSIAEQPLGKLLRARLHIDASDGLVDRLYTNNPPVHLLLLHLVNLASQSEFAYRLPFALAGIATIPVSYLVTRRIFGHAVALGGAILLALSALHVSYSQEARPTALLILFSLLSLGALIDAVDSTRWRDWLRFAAFAVIGIWCSYFSLTLVTPALGIVFLILLHGAWRAHGRAHATVAWWRGVAAFALVSLSAIPLIPDLFYTADINGAQVSRAPGPDIGLDAVITMMLTVNPIPGDAGMGIVMLLLTILGIVVLLRRHDKRCTTALTWSIAPIAILTAIKSDHKLELRYLLFIMPLVFAVIVNALFDVANAIARRISRVSAHALQIGFVAILALLSIVGNVTSTRGEIEDGITLKADWMNAVQAYAESATPESCLIYVDAKAFAVFGTVDHYIQRFKPGACAIEARDPRLLDAVNAYPDLWWAIGVQWYSDEVDQALMDAFAVDATVAMYDMVMLVRPNADPSVSNDQRAESVLRRAIAIAEPLSTEITLEFPSLRESMVNLTALRCGAAAPDQTFVSLLGGYTARRNFNNDLDWGRAQLRLDLRDYTGARVFGVMLTGRSPGDPAVYDFIAAVESGAGSAAAPAYADVAAALRSGLTPQAGDPLPTC